MNEEARLLQMFCDRDERALAAAEQRYGKLSRSVAFRILGDERDAEECANDVLMKLWDSIPPAAPRSLTAFVSGITRNLALDRLSAKQAEKRIELKVWRLLRLVYRRVIARLERAGRWPGR